jgi:FPC/CPF motif-containing protein YcgG
MMLSNLDKSLLDRIKSGISDRIRQFNSILQELVTSKTRPESGK